MQVLRPEVEVEAVSPEAAAAAARTLPERLSVRGLRRPGAAAALLCLPALVPLWEPALAWLLAPAFALAVALRLAAFAETVRDPAAAPAAVVAAELPTLTVLLPLRDEAAVLPDLVRAVRRLDYPPQLVEVLVLLEAGDAATLAAARAALPRASSWRVLVMPPGRPATKARACNAGLAEARGELLVIFDGEDRPEPDQARKAAAALDADKKRAVAQARLGCDHAGPGAPLAVRFWALEYAVLFGAVLPALARAGLPFPLGGSSNWFRTAALRQAGGWDAHNVTEDADLGIRLARLGWRSAVLDSTTWEEAPDTAATWLRQRSRWLKGFAVTCLVHGQAPLAFARGLGLSASLALAAQLPVALLSSAAHPIGLALLCTGAGGGPLAVLLAGGYVATLALHARAARIAGLPLWLVLLLPLYWLGHGAALALALRDLAHDPSHWRKTAHGSADRPEMRPPVLPSRPGRPRRASGRTSTLPGRRPRPLRTGS